MIIQSLSVCVPAGCPNKCPFCVSRMHNETYKSILTDIHQRAHADRIFIRKLSFARDNGCNTLILTGNGEPMMNLEFLNDFAKWNWRLASPFRWIEIQTSGYALTKENLVFLRDVVGVSTISLSVVDIFDDENNLNIIKPPEHYSLDYLCDSIIEAGLNLRLSINMTDVMNGMKPKQILYRCNELGAHQVTFRELYTSGTKSSQDMWIEKHNVDKELIHYIDNYIKAHGRQLERLPFGAVKYSIMDMSVVIDDDCMATAQDKDELKYLVLRPDGRLYTKWDDKGSMMF